MTQQLGDFIAGATIDFKWNTFDGSGASVTRATDGSIRIYKANSLTQRSSSAGITDTEDFDGLTGVHHCRINLADDTDAGFYAAGSEYDVVLAGAVIDGQTVNAALAHFSIEREGVLDQADGVETGKSVRQALRLMTSVLLSKCSGLDTTIPQFRDMNDTKVRVSAVADSFGNRTSVTLDPD
jgi:hypothetical protein